LLTQQHGPKSSTRSLSGEPRLTRPEVLLLALVVLVCRCLAVNAFPIYDDAFITYRYALNLGAGKGLVFNPGAPWEPVLGTTTPGYALLLGGFSALGADVILSSLTVNFVADAISAMLLMRLLEYRLVSSTVAVLAFACIPEIARISVGGMELPVVVALSLAAVVLLRRGRPLASGVAAALACIFRPECVLLVLVLAAWQWRRPRDLARFALPVVAIGALVMGTLQAVYGSPIAQSVQAKAVTTGEKLPWYRISDILAQAFGPSVPMRLLFVLAALGAVRAVLKRQALLPFMAFAVAMVAAYVVVRPKTWGWYYYAPLVAWVAWLGIGAEQVLEWLELERHRLFETRRIRALSAAGAVFAIAAVAVWSRVHVDKVTPMIYQRMDTWARQAKVQERQASILASDIGAIGYFSRSLILDANGLVWPEALDYRAHTQDAKWQVDMIRDQRPDYVFMVVKRARLAAFRADEELSACYRPIRRFNRFNTSGIEKLEPDLQSLPEWWEQDYIVYERLPAVIRQ
jgi:hypothetical protein